MRGTLGAHGILPVPPDGALAAGARVRVLVYRLPGRPMATEVPVFDAHARADALAAEESGVARLLRHRGPRDQRPRRLRRPEGRGPRGPPRRRGGHRPQAPGRGHRRLRGPRRPPGQDPSLGLDAVLAHLPERLGRPEAVAVGEVGLFEGGEREEGVFLRQIDLARDLRLPLVVTVPGRHRAKILKRTLALLRDREVPPEGALLVRTDVGSVATIRGVGYRVALGGLEAEAIAELVARHGPEGLLLASEVGDGPSDPVHLARTVDRLETAGLSRAVVRRVARENAEAFYGVTLPARSDGS